MIMQKTFHTFKKEGELIKVTDQNEETGVVSFEIEIPLNTFLEVQVVKDRIVAPRDRPGTDILRVVSN